MELPPEQRTLAAMVFVADRLTAEIKAGFRTDIANIEIPTEILDTLNITAEDIAEVRAKLPEAIRVSETVLG
jgi:tRNA threonylcarbamoyladenosine modification (KEOPS) complex  Pcc1 subunit